MNKSGKVGDNATAAGSIAGRDIKVINILNGIFGKSQKSDILEVVKILDKNQEKLYELPDIVELNPSWKRKINFNDLKSWNKIFEMWSSQLEVFEDEIIPALDFPDRLLKNLSSRYAQVSNTSSTSDEKCEQIKKELLQTVNQGKSHNIPAESKEGAVELVIYWAFTRCQIFENPPKRGEN